MPLHPTWTDILIRLVLTMLAGAILGINRGARGHAAGFRTTILVGLAACIAMIQANVLLDLSGKTEGSFSDMDLMRLPLGILTGVGFIGGGSILKKGELVRGVTTAATLWIVTVIGLCFGGGQLVIGILGTLLAVLTLWGFRSIDLLIPRTHRAKLLLGGKQIIPLKELSSDIKPLGYAAFFQGQKEIGETVHTEFEVSWHQPNKAEGPKPFDLIKILKEKYEVISLDLTTEKGDHHI